MSEAVFQSRFQLKPFSDPGAPAQYEKVKWFLEALAAGKSVDDALGLIVQSTMETPKAIPIVTKAQTNQQEAIEQTKETWEILQTIVSVYEALKQQFAINMEVPTELSDSDIQTYFLDKIKSFSTVIVDQIDDETYQRILNEWPSNSIVWSNVTSENKRLYPKESITVVVGNKTKTIAPSNGLTISTLSSSGYVIDNPDDVSPFGYQFYSEIINAVLFVASVEQILLQKRPGINSKDIEDEIRQAMEKKVNGGWRKPSVQLNNYRGLLAKMRNLPKKSKKSNVSIDTVSNHLEIIETMDNYKHVNGNYNHDAIYEDLITPICDAIESRDDWSNHAYSTFSRLGLLGNSVEVRPSLETRYYHTISLVARHIVDSADTDLLDRIDTEWPVDFVNKPLPSNVKGGRTFDI